MEYKVRIQLRDTVLSFKSATERDKKYADILTTVSTLGIPDGKLILTKVDSKYDDWASADIEKVVGSNE